MTTANTTWELKLKDSLSNGIAGVQKAIDVTKDKAEQLGQTFNNISHIDLLAISTSAQNVQADLQNFNSDFNEYHDTLDTVSLSSKITGKDLDKLGEKARDSAFEFGGNATESLRTYNTLLDKLGGQLGKAPDALANMERNVQILSKSMNNDAAGAADVLTNKLLKYGTDLDNPIQAQKEMSTMMNVIVASAKEGSSQIPNLSDALDSSADMAKKANVNFIETNAALQEFATYGIEGTDAGNAMNGVLDKMSNNEVLDPQVLKRLKELHVDMNVVSDTTLPFTDRLKELKKAQGDAALMATLFGEDNVANAKILIDSADAQEQFQQKITNTTAAEQKATEVMGTAEGVKARALSYWENLKLGVSEYTSKLEPYVTGVTNSISVLADAKNAYDGYKDAMGDVKKALGLTETATIKETLVKGVSAVGTWAVTAATWAWNTALSANPIVWVVLGVMALVGVIALCWNKFEGFRNVVFKGWEMMKLFGSTVKEYVVDRLKGLLSGITGIGSALMYFFKGDWSKAWEAGKQATKDLLGVDAAEKAIKKLKDGTPKALAAGQKASNKYTADKKAEENKSKESSVNLNRKPPVVELKGLDLKKLNETNTPGSKLKTSSGKGLSGGNDNAVGKSITMTLNIENHFTVGGDLDIRKVADKVVGLINDRLRDNLINVG